MKKEEVFTFGMIEYLSFIMVSLTLHRCCCIYIAWYVESGVVTIVICFFHSSFQLCISEVVPMAAHVSHDVCTMVQFT